MPINPDGTFSNGTNFTQTGTNNAPAAAPLGVGTSDDGSKVWNPTGGPDGRGAWEAPNAHNTATSAAGNGRGTTHAGPNGWSDGTGTLGGYGNGDATTLGKASTWQGDMGVSGAGAWGGYGGTYVQGPDGNIVFDAGQNGRQEAVDRAQGLGAAAANRTAVQIDYTGANKFADMNATDRGTQTDSLGLVRNSANGVGLQSVALGNKILSQGAQAQQAAAASTRGGSLAQAAARYQVNNGLGSYNATGQTQIQAQAATDMANARNEYMQQASAMRAGDASLQGQTQSQIAAQQAQEIQQRQLNQGTSMAYETQGQNVNKAAVDAALSADEIAHGYDATNSARQTAKADRAQQTTAAGVAAGGALVAGAGGAIFGDGNTNDQKQDNGGYKDPYSAAVSASDERAKQNVRGLGAAAMKRGGY